MPAPQPPALVTPKPFDPDIPLDPTNLKAFDDAYGKSLSPLRLAFMALPYDTADANYKPAMQTRTTPAVLSAESAREPLDLQIQVWGWGPTRAFVDAIVGGITKWKPAWGMPSFNVGAGISDPFNPPNYNENAPPPAGAILIPAVGPDGRLVAPKPYTAPVVSHPAPDPTSIIGQFNFDAIDDLGDHKLHAWYGVQWHDRAKVGSVDKTGKYVLAPFLSHEPMFGGKMYLWKSIAAVTSPTVPQ